MLRAPTRSPALPRAAAGDVVKLAKTTGRGAAAAVPPEGPLSAASASTSSSRSGPLPLARLLRPPLPEPTGPRTQRLRADRAKARRARHAVAAGQETAGPLLLQRGPHQLSIPEQASVKPSVAASCRKSYHEFSKWAARERIQLHTDEQLDAAAVDYLDSLYLEGYEAATAERLLAAIKFMRFQVPLVLDCLGNGQLSAIAGALLATRRRDAALCLLTSYDTYARPGEATEVQVGDLVLLAARLQGYRRLCLVARPEDRGLPRKAGSFDDTVAVEDFDAQLSTHLEELARGRDPSEPLFRLSVAQYKEAFEDATDIVGLGAEQRDLVAIQKRGGWKTFNSVRRCEKFGKVQQAINRTPPETLACSRLAVRCLNGWFH
ncbi:unnamed protein product, partial [Prorocentrum cordatum]